MNFTIQVDSFGVVRMWAGEDAIGLIEKVILAADMHSTTPSIQVTLANIEGLPGDQEMHRKMLARQREIKLLLSKNPFIQIFDKGDTKPSGLASVPPNDA